MADNRLQKMFRRSKLLSCSTTAHLIRASMKGGLPMNKPSKPTRKNTQHTCTRMPTTAFTTTRLRAMTRGLQSWHGAGPSTSLSKNWDKVDTETACLRVAASAKAAKAGKKRKGLTKCILFALFAVIVLSYVTTASREAQLHC